MNGLDESRRSGFASRLRRARTQKDLSQQELGELVGVHFNQISRYEQGLSQPTADNLQKLAEALGVSGDYLMEGETTNATRVNFEDQELLGLFQKAVALSPQSKEALKRIVNGLVCLDKVDELAASK